ncbi:UNVERIFIED_CONTAM: hypothetical protein PYX00_001263 [Menopon gallinae]|uniref:Coiled-coil protein 142 C-terminal domain-containing protein n=1 Tax=Menopon gallinae TaxID=328185 RepID=A0AAW2ID85_9NEOP
MPDSKVDAKRKWLPDEDADSVKFYGECKASYRSCKALISTLKDVLVKQQEGQEPDQEFEEKIQNMAAVMDALRRISLQTTKSVLEEVENCKRNIWKSRLWIERLAISKLAYDIISCFLDSPLTELVLRLAHLYNESLLLTFSNDVRNINVYSNKCPMMLYPLRKLSITKLLQILAKKRAENCSFMFIEGLLTNYPLPNRPTPEKEAVVEKTPAEGEKQEADQAKDEEKGTQLLNAQDSISSDTSIEIYRALTKHFTQGGEPKETCSKPLELLLRFEDKRIRTFLHVCANSAVQIIGSNCIKTSKTTEVLWGEVGGYVEHGLLWWTSDPLGSASPIHSHQLRDYLMKLKDADSVPPLLIPAVNSLIDALCCHTTSTSWDQLFRKTLVFAGSVKSHAHVGYGIEGTATGQLFAEMLTDLVQLNNTCEDPHLLLEQLPLVEQIPVLHRLDHSVHTVRLWTANQCRHLAASWNLDEFYCTCHTDISKCLDALSKLQMADHGKIPTKTSVQVTVCAQMRAKLTSEVRENIEKLKKTPGECINVLGRACRTQCLANLHMTFPPAPYWRQSGPLPDYASEYVENYLVVFELDDPQNIMRILAGIRIHAQGEVQRVGSGAAADRLRSSPDLWLMERVQLQKELLHPLVTHEVLRRCEGVGRLLLRRRGESIAMSTPGTSKSSDESSADNMPAEMYVPNQEQWLELRAPLQANICCQL